MASLRNGYLNSYHKGEWRLTRERRVWDGGGEVFPKKRSKEMEWSKLRGQSSGVESLTWSRCKLKLEKNIRAKFKGIKVIKEFCLHSQSIKGFLFGANKIGFGVEKVTSAVVCRMGYRNKNGCR